MDRSIAVAVGMIGIPGTRLLAQADCSQRSISLSEI
jgi:hypothetical protein